MSTNHWFSCANENLAWLKKAFELNFLCLPSLLEGKTYYGGKEVLHCFCGMNRITLLLISFEVVCNPFRSCTWHFRKEISLSWQINWNVVTGTFTTAESSERVLVNDGSSHCLGSGLASKITIPFPSGIVVIGEVRAELRMAATELVLVDAPRARWVRWLMLSYGNYPSWRWAGDAVIGCADQLISPGLLEGGRWSQQGLESGCILSALPTTLRLLCL